MSDFDWSERFPDMRPVRSAPALTRVNGIGVGIYGSRDADEETGTYVTTYCFCIFFIPVFALTAYRVANAPNGGWYFLGRVPLSSFARAWNMFVVFAAISAAGLFGWNAYFTSVDYLAGRRLAEADALAANGQLAKAAPLYREVAIGRSTHAAEAAQHLQGLLANPGLNNLKDATTVFRAAIEVQQRTGSSHSDLEQPALKLIEQHGEKNLQEGLEFARVLQPIAKDSPKLAAQHRVLLERSVALDPNDVALASELALLYEADNQLPRCEKILLPLKDRLDDSEGARILGVILARGGKVEEACAVLGPYTEKKLPQLRSTEQAFHNATQQLITRIKNGNEEGFPYQKFRSADEAGKRNIFSQYLGEQLKDDPSLKKANQSYQEARGVVPAALDLGILLLRRAQMRADAAAREADLQKAEKVFLALQEDEAAESSAYRLSLGQVYYWLGKTAEGRKKFDEVLAAENRNPQMLQAIARLLREVGEHNQACSLLEEAYNKEPEKEKKFEAALTRSVLAVELDDKITWLQRADPNDSQVKADLSTSRADKAIEEGKPAEAEPHLRQALDLYQQMPESAAGLNNAALVLLTLYSVTGDRQLLAQAEKKFDKAVSLEPRNSILLENVAHTLLQTAARDVIGPAIDLTALKKSGSRSLLSFLYDDGEGERRVTERFCTHPATVKATTYLERLLILAPKNPTVYRQLLELYEDQRNLDKLRDLAVRLQRTPLDLAEEEKRTRELFAGKRDEKNRKDMQAQLERYSKRVAAAGRAPRGVTYAVAAADLVVLRLGLAVFGAAVDSKEVVELAESAYQAAPSVATRGYLETALLFRASVNLARKDAAYAELAAQSGRSLSPTDWLAVILERDGPRSSLALADADVQRALELAREGSRKAPDMPHAWAWAMLRSDQPQAEKLAKLIRMDAVYQQARALNAKLHPLSADKALRLSWTLHAAGKDKEAAAVLQECAARGVPMPHMP